MPWLGTCFIALMKFVCELLSYLMVSALTGASDSSSRAAWYLSSSVEFSSVRGEICWMRSMKVSEHGTMQARGQCLCWWFHSSGTWCSQVPDGCACCNFEEFVNKLESPHEHNEHCEKNNTLIELIFRTPSFNKEHVRSTTIQVSVPTKTRSSKMKLYKELSYLESRLLKQT